MVGFLTLSYTLCSTEAALKTSSPKTIGAVKNHSLTATRGGRIGLSSKKERNKQKPPILRWISYFDNCPATPYGTSVRESLSLWELSQRQLTEKISFPRYLSKNIPCICIMLQPPEALLSIGVSKRLARNIIGKFGNILNFEMLHYNPENLQVQMPMQGCITTQKRTEKVLISHLQWFWDFTSAGNNGWVTL